MTITDMPPVEAVLSEWYRVHDDQAGGEEGWSIFEAEYLKYTDDSDCDHIGIELQLQRIDEAGVFEGDQDAWRWVWAHRGRPGTAEQDALSLLARFSPVEFSRILAVAYDWPL